jgi:L-amino acid N-acyltransferase YncA
MGRGRRPHPAVSAKAGPERDEPAIAYRRPVEADYPALAAALDDWLGRRARLTVPRLWIRHFGRTAWLAESGDGRAAGVLIGFLSPDEAAEAVVTLVTVRPSLRRRGIGRELHARFAADARAASRRRVVTAIWPGDPGCLAFHRALGFEAETRSDSQHLYGTSAVADYDGDGEDRAILVRPI